MKKISVLIIILAGMFLFPLSALAVDYTIEQTRIDAYLQENGDVQVREQHTYSFEGEFNGITRTLIPKEETAITDVSASEDGTALEVEQDDNEYRIYRGGEDETITVNLSYLITGGLEVYPDVAQFYWPFFDKGNESDYQQLDIFIHPPEPAENVIAFGYDAAAGTAAVEDEGVAHFAMGTVESGQNGDIRVAYDANLFPGADLAGDQPIGGEILDAKTELEEKQAAFASRKETLGNMAPYVVGIFVIYLLGVFFWAWRKKRAVQLEVERRFAEAHFVPKEEMSMPATISYMKPGMAGAETMTAALLDLVRKGYVRRENEDTFVAVDRNTEHKHEEFLVQWLFDTIGTDGVFRLDDLTAFTDDKSNHQAYQEDFQAWKQAISEEIKSNNLTEKKAKQRTVIALTSVLLIPFAILFGIHELFISMTLAILFFLILILFAAFYQPRTVKGARIYKEWLNFHRLYPDKHEKEWNEWMDDERKRAFIYGFGINDSQLSKKNDELAEQPGFANSDLVMFVVLAFALNQQFDKANSTASVAAASSGGGTPGAGAGVGGGGGGSGAF
ncbi:DUF2207 domain-containing protein [Lentibacillus sediminis]|uniref:DUF2207 domain-containing protein n=1 Tax=Lentibacillus sediminis TaxID=1940529 RepID=UPI000C1C5D87|nr:DUF2207 domain-containing protein [Lentibacillus sediminis]